MLSPDGNGALFEPDPWRDPEERRKLAEEALANRDWQAIGELFERYLSSHRNYSHESVRTYRRAVEDFWAYVWNDLGREGLRLSPSDVRSWLHDLESHGVHVLHEGARRTGPRPLGRAGLRTMLYGLLESRAFFTWLGHPLPEHVDWPRPLTAKAPSALNDSQYKAFLSQASRLDPLGGMPLVIRLIGEMGMRWREVCHVTPADFTDDALRVKREPVIVDRTVRLPPDLRRPLFRFVETVISHGFDERVRVLLVQRSRHELRVVSPRTLQAKVTVAARSAGLPPFYLRALRNRGAIELYKRYGNPEKVAGLMGLTAPPAILDRWLNERR